MQPFIPEKWVLFLNIILFFVHNFKYHLRVIYNDKVHVKFDDELSSNQINLNACDFHEGTFHYYWQGIGRRLNDCLEYNQGT